jgi:small subunit ribosomal protein S27Ae
MADAKKQSKKEKKIHTLYTIKGDTVERKRRFCPKCGPGFFMAQHKDRVVCGKCGYMEKSAKKE